MQWSPFFNFFNFFNFLNNLHHFLQWRQRCDQLAHWATMKVNLKTTSSVVRQTRWNKKKKKKKKNNNNNNNRWLREQMCEDFS